MIHSVKPQSLRKYSTVVTTRTFLRYGVKPSRSEIENWPWFARRIFPKVLPESPANFSAAVRAFFVAS